MSTIRVQALPKFPASVEAGDGIAITRTNGTYVFSADPGAGIFQLANATTVRVENAFSSAVKPAVEFRDTAVGVTAGGLWRAANTSGGLTFQKNTSAGGDFSTSTNFFRLDSAAATTVFDAAVNFNNAVLQLLTDPGAGAGPDTGNYRDSASPASNDFIGRFSLYGNNSSAAALAYAQIGAQILDATASSEDGILMLRTVVAGSLADRLTIGQGAQIGAPTGGDKGTGTLNAATGLYVANVAVPTISSTDEFTNKTLNTAVGKGTWTASGTWTLPALTLGGAITYGGVTLSNAVTGTGNMVLSSSPTLATPNIGVATAVSVNKVAFTAPATSATITIADGTTLTQTTSTSVGRGQYLAVDTNTAATAGNVGEYSEASRAFASRIMLGNASPAVIATVSLGPGEWDVQSVIYYETDTTTTITECNADVSETSSFDGNTGRYATLVYPAGTVLGAGFPAIASPTVRKSFNSSTSVHAIARANFGASFVKAWGLIRATRPH